MSCNKKTKGVDSITEPRPCEMCDKRDSCDHYCAEWQSWFRLSWPAVCALVRDALRK